jgi:hypothetical protein
MNYSGWDDDMMKMRELMVAVVQQWFPDDDAPYNRLDELLDPARKAGYQFGITETRIDRWCEAATELDRLGHTVQGIGRQFMSNACIHEEHGKCEEECSYCEDGCACDCHPWNEHARSS